MFQRLIGGLAALAAAACAWTAAAAAPLDAYGKLPSIEQVAISPGGNLIAYVVTDGDQRVVTIQSVDARELVLTAPVGAAKLRDVTWAGDKHLILTTSTSVQPTLEVSGPRIERWLAFDLDLAERQLSPLMDNLRGANLAMNTVHSAPIVRVIGGKPTVFFFGEHFVSNLGQLGLFKINLDSHVATMVQDGRHATTGWLLDASGGPVAQSLYDDRSGVWTVQVKAANGWRTVQTVHAPLDAPALLGLGREPHTVLVDLDDEKLGSGWRTLSTETGAWGDLIETQSESPLFDPASGRLIGTHALAGDAHVYTFYDPHDAAVWRGVLKAFPGDQVTLADWTQDRKRIVVRVDSAKLGPAYALIDLTTGHADWLGEVYRAIRAEDISAVRPVRYPAADGLEITGYLTLPVGRQPHDLPLVVLAHGGPADRDTPGFDWWAQALASRGYAVLQANFRGSTGLGARLYSAGFGEFGRKMQTDLSDGVRYLATLGVVDPKRVCIVGASYGGYAALAGATIDHGVYRCAAAYGGVFDLRGLVRDFEAKQGLEATRYWYRFIGAKNGADPVLTSYSPLARAAEADIPVLLIHGKDDTVVPIDQSRRMAAALTAAGKPVTLTVLAGEDHWLSRGDTRLKMLTAVVEFLEKNNPPQ